MNELEINKLNKILDNDKDNTKMSVKFLKEITIKYWPDNTDSIFNSDDTCFCSLSRRTLYKNRFISFYDTIKK